jgi:hypothetical protein
MKARKIFVATVAAALLLIGSGVAQALPILSSPRW